MAMKKLYLWELVAALGLLATTEAYFWTQSRNTSDSGAVKLLVVLLYVAVAVVSQRITCLVWRCPLSVVVKTNLFVAAMVSLGVTALPHTMHPAMLKGAGAGWRGAAAASLKFFSTVGVATMFLRIGTAASIHERASMDGPTRSPSADSHAKPAPRVSGQADEFKDPGAETRK